MDEQPKFTEEEWKAVAETLEALAVASAAPAEAQIKCPVCKQPATNRQQVGRCVYMAPCGHHYQGRLKLKK
jgi:hypothetical protein